MSKVVEELVDDDEFALLEIDSKCDEIQSSLKQMEQMDDSRQYRLETLLGTVNLTLQDIQQEMQRDEKEEEKPDLIKEGILQKLRELSQVPPPQVLNIVRDKHGFITQVIVKS